MAYARGNTSANSMRLRPSCDISVVGGCKVLTNKQLETFNEQYSHLQGEMYVDALRAYENRYGFRESNYQIN